MPMRLVCARLRGEATGRRNAEEPVTQERVVLAN